MKITFIVVILWIALSVLNTRTVVKWLQISEQVVEFGSFLNLFKLVLVEAENYNILCESGTNKTDDLFKEIEIRLRI